MKTPVTAQQLMDLIENHLKREWTTDRFARLNAESILKSCRDFLRAMEEK